MYKTKFCLILFFTLVQDADASITISKNKSFISPKKNKNPMF